MLVIALVFAPWPGSHGDAQEAVKIVEDQAHELALRESDGKKITRGFSSTLVAGAKEFEPPDGPGIVYVKSYADQPRKCDIDLRVGEAKFVGGSPDERTHFLVVITDLQPATVGVRIMEIAGHLPDDDGRSTPAGCSDFNWAAAREGSRPAWLPPDVLR